MKHDKTAGWMWGRPSFSSSSASKWPGDLMKNSSSNQRLQVAGPGHSLPRMVGYLVRQAAMFVVALGLLLNGAFPCCAYAGAGGTMPMPAGMAMPGMSMPQASKALGEKGTPAKGVPCNDLSGCFAFCTCAIPAVSQNGLSVQFYHHGDVWFPSDVNRDGIAILPDLPPPIV